MKSAIWRRWLPVAVGAAATLATVVFAFIPFNRQARTHAIAAAAADLELQGKLALLTTLPHKQTELDSLREQLGQFRAGLHRTDEIDALMSELRSRGEAAGAAFWTLDPSLPTLLSLARAKDSVAALNLALLPVAFECYGAFIDVGRFLEAEEHRADFCQWNRLIVIADARRGVRAQGEFVLFLLPAENFAEAAS